MVDIVDNTHSPSLPRYVKEGFVFWGLHIRACLQSKHTIFCEPELGLRGLGVQGANVSLVLSNEGMSEWILARECWIL